MTCSHDNSNDNLVKAKWKCSMNSNCTGVLDQYCVDSRVTYHWQFCNDAPVSHGNTQVETGFIFGIPTQKDLSCVWKKIDPDRKFVYITAVYIMEFAITKGTVENSGSEKAVSRK